MSSQATCVFKVNSKLCYIHYRPNYRVSYLTKINCYTFILVRVTRREAFSLMDINHCKQIAAFSYCLQLKAHELFNTTAFIVAFCISVYPQDSVICQLYWNLRVDFFDKSMSIQYSWHSFFLNLILAYQQSLWEDSYNMP